MEKEFKQKERQFCDAIWTSSNKDLLLMYYDIQILTCVLSIFDCCQSTPFENFKFLRDTKHYFDL